MKNIVTICITAVICVSIFAFPFYYQTFAADDEEPAPTVITEEAAATSRYTSIGEIDSASHPKLIIDQDTGGVYIIIRNSYNDYDVTFVGKIG